MTYTRKQADAFERVLELLRRSAGYNLRKEIHKMATDPYVRVAKLEITSVSELVALTKTVPWATWLKDYEELAVHQHLTAALELLPTELARLIAREHRQTLIDRRAGGGKRTALEVVEGYMNATAERLDNGKGMRLWTEGEEEPTEFAEVPTHDVAHPAENANEEAGSPAAPASRQGPGNPRPDVPAAVARRGSSSQQPQGGKP